MLLLIKNQSQKEKFPINTKRRPKYKSGYFFLSHFYIISRAKICLMVTGAGGGTPRTEFKNEKVM